MTINHKILQWARKKVGHKVGDGECWTYVERAVTKSGGVSSKDLTKDFGTKSDYIWGNTVALNDVQPGDLLQFRNYRWDTKSKIKITFNDGAWFTLPTGFRTRGEPNHSAIVNRVLSDGSVEVLEQNIKPDLRVIKTKLRLTSLKLTKRTSKEKQKHPQTKKFEIATIETTMTEIVSGKVSAYRAKLS